MDVVVLARLHMGLCWYYQECAYGSCDTSNNAYGSIDTTKNVSMGLVVLGRMPMYLLVLASDTSKIVLMGVLVLARMCLWLHCYWQQPHGAGRAMDDPYTHQDLAPPSLITTYPLFACH